MTKLDSLLWRSRSTLERHDSLDNTEVRYEFPLGFQISVRATGIIFTGTSVNYDVGSIQLVEQTIRWAKLINAALRAKQGIPPQAECEGRLILQSKGIKAWWKGAYKDAIKDEIVPGGPVVSAAVILRRMTRKTELEQEREL